MRRRQAYEQQANHGLNVPLIQKEMLAALNDAVQAAIHTCSCGKVFASEHGLKIHKARCKG